MTADLGGATTPSAPQTFGGFSGQNWADIISGLIGGAASSRSGLSGAAGSRKEAKESKRRTIANLLTGALTGQQKSLMSGLAGGNALADIDNQAMQHLASGFISSLLK